MKIGFVGVGNMGGAILKGYAASRKEKTSDIFAIQRNQAALKKLSAEFGVNTCKTISDLVDVTDVILLGVKPNMFEEIMPEVAEKYDTSKVIISMAAGISIAFLEGYLGAGAKVIRIMPNTPSMVGEAMTSVSRNKNVGDDIFEEIFQIFESIGKAEEVPEELIHCVIGVSGSSPAYTYMYIDALIKAAIKNGMNQKQATVFSAQAVLGAAKMVLETGISPEQLKVNVCSPGGATIQAVDALVQRDFEGVVLEGFQAAVEKSKKMVK